MSKPPKLKPSYVHDHDYELKGILGLVKFTDKFLLRLVKEETISDDNLRDLVKIRTSLICSAAFLKNILK